MIWLKLWRGNRALNEKFIGMVDTSMARNGGKKALNS